MSDGVGAFRISSCNGDVVVEVVNELGDVIAAGSFEPADARMMAESLIGAADEAAGTEKPESRGDA